jgi:hypothetical protein
MERARQSTYILHNNDMVTYQEHSFDLDGNPKCFLYCWVFHSMSILALPANCQPLFIYRNIKRTLKEEQKLSRISLMRFPVEKGCSSYIPIQIELNFGGSETF